ncbi:MAG: glycosyltransferase family 4 protein [Planctomycetota bacterium]
MKVLMVVHSYYPYDPRVRREAESLRDRGDSVDIVCLKNENEPAFETIRGINVYRLPVSRHRGSGLVRYLAEYLAFFLLASCKVTKLFIANQYRVIQVHTIPDWLVFCTLIPRLLGARVILDMHEVMPEFFSYRYNLPAGHPVIRLTCLSERLSTAFADKVITVSDGLKDILVSRGVPAGKITIVMNSADDKVFRRTVKTASHNPQSGIIFSYHGLVSDIYDLSVVFRALAKLKSQIPNMKFLVIGDGPQAAEYKNTVNRLGISDMVSFLGHHPQEKVVEMLCGIDVGIVPLKDAEFTHLAFPTKLVEYAALGIPAITAQRRTVAQYFNSDAVCFYKPDDDASLAEAILELHRHPDKRTSMVRRAFECYDKISWGVMKERYYNLIGRAAGR